MRVICDLHKLIIFYEYIKLYYVYFIHEFWYCYNHALLGIGLAIKCYFLQTHVHTTRQNHGIIFVIVLILNFLIICIDSELML